MKRKIILDSILSGSIIYLQCAAIISDRWYLHFRIFRSILKQVQIPGHIKRVKYTIKHLRVRGYPAVWGSQLTYLEYQINSGTAGSFAASESFLTGKNGIYCLYATSWTENCCDKNNRYLSNALINLGPDRATQCFPATKSIASITDVARFLQY